MFFKTKEKKIKGNIPSDLYQLIIDTERDEQLKNFNPKLALETIEGIMHEKFPFKPLIPWSNNRILYLGSKGSAAIYHQTTLTETKGHIYYLDLKDQIQGFKIHQATPIFYSVKNPYTTDRLSKGYIKKFKISSDDIDQPSKESIKKLIEEVSIPNERFNLLFQ